MKEHDKAKRWRESHNLSVQELADLTGYSRYAVYLFEKGATAQTSDKDHGKISAQVWQRYKLCCSGVDAARKGKKFNW